MIVSIQVKKALGKIQPQFMIKKKKILKMVSYQKHIQWNQKQDKYICYYLTTKNSKILSKATKQENKGSVNIKKEYLIKSRKINWK